MLSSVKTNIKKLLKLDLINPLKARITVLSNPLINFPIFMAIMLLAMFYQVVDGINRKALFINTYYHIKETLF